MTVTISETAEPISPPLLQRDEPEPYRIINADGKARCLIICDHASNYIPAKLNNLGLGEDALSMHIAWDIGACALTELVSDMLDAPAILANYSRLVVDCNRRLDHPTAFVTSGDGQPVPGNVTMSEQERAMRVEEIYAPYHRKIEQLIKGYTDNGIVPVIFSIHSFTRLFFNQVRPWEIGFLWVQDDRVTAPMMEYFDSKGYTVGDNEPYDARILRGTTINQHADAAGLPNALVEICNEELGDEAGIRKWAGMLSESVGRVLEDESVYSYYKGPVIMPDPEKEKSYFDELITQAKEGES